MPKNYRILGINTSFSSLNEKVIVQDSIRSTRLFLDFDIILIDTTDFFSAYREGYMSTHNGKELFSKEQSCSITEDFDRTNNQIIEYLKQGKTLFVVLGKNDRSYIYTGGTRYRGTGRDAQNLKYICEADPFSFLPVSIKPTFMDGERYSVICRAPYKHFFEKTKDVLCYNAYFDTSKNVLATSPNGKAISAVFEVEKGKIVILPDYYTEGYFEDEEEGRKHIREYIDALIELNKALEVSEEAYHLPQWTDGIKVLSEMDEEKELQRIEKDLKTLEAKRNNQKDVLEHVQRKKRLIAASGSILEDVVKDVLQEIGFVLCEAEIGRSDIVATYKEIDVVAEIKGVTKSAAEKHAAQLEKWSARFVDKNERVPKALLIVNGYCETPLEKRTEEVFPDQMLEYCIARKHALITTTQLLCLYTEIKTNPECADERINELLSCVGRYQRYQNYKDYITIKSEES